MPCLVPDLPSTSALLPWLARLDETRWYSNFGPLLREFELKLADALPQPPTTPAAVATVSSGTVALEVALLALDLPPGSTVLVPSFTFPATASAVVRAGHAPVLVDVDPISWALTPKLAREALEHLEADAVVPVAAFGMRQPAMAWDAFSREMGIPVVIDAAAAWGSQEVLGSVVVTFSLHATKPLGIGEGGVVASRDPAFVERCRRLVNFGFGDDRRIHWVGLNGKLSEMACAVGLAQLERWDEIRARRRALYDGYRASLGGSDVSFRWVEPPAPAPAVLAVRCPGGATPVERALAEDGIETRRWYCPALHAQPAYEGLRKVGPQGDPALPVSTRLGEEILGLPFHTYLDDRDVQLVGDRVRALTRLTRGLVA